MIVFAAVAVWLVGLARQSFGTSAIWLVAALVFAALAAWFLIGWRKVLSVLLLALLPLAAILFHSPSATVQQLTNNFETTNARFLVLQDSSRSFGAFGAETSAKVELRSVQSRDGWLPANSVGVLSTKASIYLHAGETYRGRLQFAPANRSGSEFRATAYLAPKLLAEAPAWQRFVSELKRSFLGKTRGVNADAKALVTGLAIGNTEGLSPTSKTSMATVSLTHLIAVSGANCAIVMAAVFFLLGRVLRKRWWRFAVSEAVLLAYVYITEAPSSVIRAAIMATIVILAKTMGRKLGALNSLGLAVLVVFTVWPTMPSDIGFALSAVATAGLLVVAPALFERLPTSWPKWLRAAIAVSAAAQLMCTPILLQFQAGLPLYAVAANLLAEPLVAPVTILGLLALLVVYPMPWLASVLVYMASIFTNYIVGLANWFAQLPEALVPWIPGGAGEISAAVLVIGIVIWATLKTSNVRHLLAIGLLLVGGFELAGAGIGYLTFVRWPTSDWFVISCDVGQGDATLIRSQNHYALIDVGRNPEPIARCLNRLGVHHLDLLVLTHFDMDHVGGVTGVLPNVSIDQALVTSFTDTRPGANFVRDELDAWQVNTLSSGVGVVGRLGEFNWRVLSPHLGAQEAEDSNDGSVTMLFDSSRVSILTLADLGEKGQMRLAREKASWMPRDFFSKPLVLKVSHHGSADQYPEFIESLRPRVALISVGLNNGYGHPTKRALSMLRASGAEIERTDLMGSVAIGLGDGGNELERSTSGASLVGATR